MTVKEAENYLDDLPRFTEKHSLDHTRECLRRLGDPQNSFGILHVAGTNGKGSTCAFLAQILQEAGHRTGLFTSPHLVSILERFRTDGEDVRDEAFLRAFRRVRKLAVELESEGKGHPTYFEMIFLIGMLIFQEEKAEYVVLETGLGGRLDATTAAGRPLVCVITSISRDHMEYLGDTVEEIAWEKAGILVPGVPVVYDGSDPRAAQVIREQAEEKGCPRYEVRPEETRILKKTPAGIDFSLRNAYDEDTVFFVPFAAEYQVQNAALAIRAAGVLGGLEPSLSLEKDVVARGIARTRWEGRMETVLPGVVLDGAHNEDGIRRFAEAAADHRRYGPVTLLFSAVSSKDHREMVRILCEKVRPERVITTQTGGARQTDCETLAEEFRANGCSAVRSVPDPRTAFRTAFAEKKQNETLLCAGSLYLIGELKKEIADLTSKEKDYD